MQIRHHILPKLHSAADGFIITHDVFQRGGFGHGFEIHRLEFSVGILVGKLKHFQRRFHHLQVHVRTDHAAALTMVWHRHFPQADVPSFSFQGHSFG